MTDEQKQKIIFRHAFVWGLAFITPPIVMVILDIFDLHTPTRVALFSSMALMFVFVLSNTLLAQGLAAIKTEASE